jgi:hypothetical protein
LPFDLVQALGLIFLPIQCISPAVTECRQAITCFLRRSLANDESNVALLHLCSPSSVG